MWNRVKLSEIASSVDYGHTAPSTNQPIGPRFLRITDIQDDQVDWETVPFCECSPTEENASKLEAGDIVFARTGATTGKSFLIKECPDRAIFASYLIRVRSNSDVLPDYLAHFFKTPEYWAQISLNARGAAQAGVNATVLKSLSVPLPPIAQQKRIAAILDKADELRSLRRRALEQLDAIAQSTFLEMFGNPATNPKEWKKNKLANYIQLIGGFAFQSQDFVLDGIPLIRIGTINQGTFKDSDLVYLPEEFYERYKKFIVYPGDILMTLTGTIGKEDYGNIFILGNQYNKYFLNQRVAKITFESSTFEPSYFLYVFKNPLIKSGLTKLSRGIRQANISNEDILGLSIPIPPISLQQEFTQRLKTIEQLKATHRESLAQLDALFASLQHRAFRGEL